MVNSFGFSLNITVTIDILQEIIKKQLAEWSFQRASNKWIEACHTSYQIKSPCTLI